MTRRANPAEVSATNRHASPERRQHRSQNMEKALGLLLDAARRRQGFAAIAVADESGLLVAGSGHFGQCEELAAYAPLAAQPRARAHQRREVQSLSVDGINVLVTGLDAREPGLEAVVDGCRRILGRRRPALATA